MVEPTRCFKSPSSDSESINLEDDHYVKFSAKKVIRNEFRLVDGIVSVDVNAG